MNETSLLWLHLVHGLVVLATTGLLAVFYRKRFQLENNHYLRYWIWACVTWGVYYISKWAGLISSYGSPEDSWAFSIKLYTEFTLNLINSAFILAASFTLSEKAAEANFWRMRWRLIVLIIMSTAAAQFLLLVICGGGGLLGLSDFQWAVVDTIATSFLGGIVLMLFFHRLVQRNHIPSKWSAVALWWFFGYAFLQSWYTYIILNPTISLPRDVPIKIIWCLYALALVLKLACTFTVFWMSVPPTKIPAAGASPKA